MLDDLYAILAAAALLSILAGLIAAGMFIFSADYRTEIKRDWRNEK